MNHQGFFQYVEEVVSKAPLKSLDEFANEMEGFKNIYLIYVDILKGFCETGPLSSVRVNEMVEPVVRFTEKVLKKGLPQKNLVFLHDSHPENAVEFDTFAPHCMKGTEEAQVVSSLGKYMNLAKEHRQVFVKNATNGLFGKNHQGVRFADWLENVLHQRKTAFIVVGDCTDLCIYQNAMAIRLLANELNAKTRVIVPKALVRTYDLPVDQAEKAGVLAHDAKFLESVFFYHLVLNGIEVIEDWQGDKK